MTTKKGKSQNKATATKKRGKSQRKGIAFIC
jgi:hypothetical protein